MARRDVALPRIVERRPRKKRPCLRCGRVIVTVIDHRLCKPCAAANEEMVLGTLVEASTVLVRLQVGDA